MSKVNTDRKLRSIYNLFKNLISLKLFKNYKKYSMNKIEKRIPISICSRPQHKNTTHNEAKFIQANFR